VSAPRTVALAPAQTAGSPAVTDPPDAGSPAPTPASTSPAGTGPAGTGPAGTGPAGTGPGRRAWWLPGRAALLRLVSPLGLLVAWQAVSSAGIVSADKLPPPTEVWSTAVSLVTSASPAYGSLQGNLLASLERVAVGFAFGATAALLLAIAAGLSRLGENAVDPLMQMLRTLPLFGLIPVFIVWFGIGELPKILLIAIGSGIPLYLNTFSGIRNVDARLGELGQVLGLRRRELIGHIVLPGALPQVLVGLRQSLAVAWLALVVAEQFNTNAGLGFMISQGTQFDRNDVIFVALLVYCVLGLLTDSLVRLAERRALSWRRSFTAQ
jgi:sulfonate transport system permease protein